MEDPIQRHPTRQEQLDILVSVIDELCRPGDQLLDLGCGTGYFADLLLSRNDEIQITGVDLSADALESASSHLAPYARFSGIRGDLRTLADIRLPANDYAFMCSCLTFHDLNDTQKRAVIDWAGSQLRPGGYFFLYDRIRLTAPTLYPAQLAIWQRLERVHGRGMRTAPSFPAYIEDLGQDNTPAPLESYFDWFREAEFEVTCLHLHGNVALLGATSPRPQD